MVADELQCDRCGEQGYAMFQKLNHMGQMVSSVACRKHFKGLKTVYKANGYEIIPIKQETVI